MQSIRKFKVKCIRILGFLKVNWRCNQPRWMANSVTDKEQFILRLKRTPTSKKKKKGGVEKGRTPKDNVNQIASKHACLIDLGSEMN